VIRTLSVIAASVFAIGCASSVAQTALAQTPAPTAAMPGPPTASATAAPAAAAPAAAPATAPAAAPAAAAALGPDGLPTGPGHELTMRVCTACHGPEMFTEKRFDRNGWDDTVQMMAGRGAQATPEEFKQITDYLAAALPAA
jgi:hypothetical protein